MPGGAGGKEDLQFLKIKKNRQASKRRGGKEELGSQIVRKNCGTARKKR